METLARNKLFAWLARSAARVLDLEGVQRLLIFAAHLGEFRLKALLAALEVSASRFTPSCSVPNSFRSVCGKRAAKSPF